MLVLEEREDVQLFRAAARVILNSGHAVMIVRVIRK